MAGIHFDITADNTPFINSLNQTRNALRTTIKDIESQGITIEQYFKSIKQTAGALAAGFSAKAFVNQIVQVRGEFQQLEVAFKTMLGSEEKAATLMEQLTKTAAVTPFDLQGVTNGAKQLLAYGISADDVNDKLIHLGDIAAGLSLPLNDLVYLYGTTMTQGRMFTQDLRQFQGRGIPIAEELAKIFNTTKDKVGELVTAGKVGAKEFNQAIMAMSSEGGKFAGLMEAQSKTIAGQISNIGDAIDSMFNNMGKQSEGIINGTLSVVSSLVENYQKVGEVIGGVVATYGTYKAAVMTVTALQGLQAAGIGALTTAETIHYGWLVLCEKAQKLLNATMLANPYVLAATAVAGLVAVMVTMKTEQERVNEAYDEYNQKKSDIIRKEEEHKARIEELARVAGDESLSTDTRRMALVELEQKYPAIFAKYDTEAEKLKHIRDLKAEIAALDGKGSITKASNELSSVEKRIRELEKKGAATYTSTVTQYGASLYSQTGGRSQKEEAELKALQRRRSELTNQIRKDEGNAYLTNLTGVSNEDLKKQIDERRNLLARMEVNDKKYGRTKQGGVMGVYTRDELQGQLQILQSEQARRKKVLEDSSKDFVAETNRAYKKEQDALRKLESLTDPKKRSASKQVIDGKKVSEMSGDEFLAAVEKQQKAVDEAKKKVDAYNKAKNGGSKSDKTASESAARNAKQLQDQWKHEQEMSDLQEKAARAREDASIAAIQSQAERERKEREAQHRRTIEDLKSQEDDIYKAIYEQRKRAYETVNKGKYYENTEEGKAGYLSSDAQEAMRKSFTDDEQKLYLERKTVITAGIEQENAIWSRYIQDRYKQEAQAMRDFLKEYGDYEQKKLAITQDYEQRIKDESDPSRKAALMMQRDRDLETLSSEQAKQQIDWDGIFSDLQGHTKEYLEDLRSQLQTLISSGTLKLDEMEVAQGKIRDINALIAEQGGLFSFITPLQIEYNRRLQAEADAKKLLEQARVEQSNQEAAVVMARQALSALLKDSGKVVSGEITAAMTNPFKEGTEEYDKFNDLIAKLITGEGKLSEARKKTAEATRQVNAAEDGAKWNAKAREKWEDFLNSKGMKNMMANVSSAPELLSNLGLGDASEKAQKGLDGMNDAMGAVTDFMSQNYIGALSKGISAVTNFGEALGLWSNSNREETEEANNKLQRSMDLNTEAINRNTEAMKNSSPIDAFEAYSRAVREMQANERAARQQMENNAYMYDGGHSLNADLGSIQAIRDIFNKLGIIPNGDAYDLGALIRTLTAQDWNRLFEDSEGERLLQELSEAIRNAEDSGNYNGMMQDILDFANTYRKEEYDNLKNILRESVTGVSFDSMYDSFLSSLMDMDKAAEDWSNDFEGYLRNAIYKTLAADQIKPLLEGWYKAFAHFMNDNELSEAEIEALRHGSGGFYDEISGEWEEWQGIDSITAAGDELRNTIEALGLFNGKAEETNETVSSLSDNIRSAFSDLLGDPTKDVEEWGRSLRNSLIREFIQTQILGEDFEEWAKGMAGRYNEAWSRYTAGEISGQELSGIIAGIDSDMDAFVDDVTQRTRQIQEAFGYAFDEEQAEGAFSGLRSTFLDTLTDMEGDAESFKKKLEATMVRDVMEKQVFDVPFSIVGMTYEDFDAYVEDWNRRYADAVQEGNQEAVDALLDELVRARELTIEAAGELRDRLREVTSDDTFKSMSDNFVSALTDMTKSTEDWADNIRGILADKIVRQMVVPTMIQPLLDRLQAVYNSAANATGATAGSITEAVMPALDAIREAYPAIQSVVRNIMDGLGLDTKTAQGFGNLRSDFLSALTDMESDAKKFGKSIGVSMAEQMAEQYVSGRYGETIDALNNRWREALEAGDSGKMADIRRELEALYEVMADDAALKEFTDNIKAAQVEADTTFSGMTDSFVSSLMDFNATAEEWAKDLGQTIAQKIIEETVMGTMLQPLLDDLQNAVSGALDLYGGNYDGIMADGGIQQALQAITVAYPQLKEVAESIMAAFGVTNDVENPFSDLRSSFVSSLMDMNSDAETFGKEIGRTLIQQMMDEVLVKAGFQDEIEALGRQWAEALKEGDTGAIESIRQKLIEVRERMDGSVQPLLAELKEFEKQADTTFSGMTDSWVSALMDMDATADEWAENVGRTMAQKIITELIAPVYIQPILNEMQAAFDAAMAIPGATIRSVVSAMTPYIDEVKDVYAQLQPIVQDIFDSFGIYKESVEEAVDEVEYALQDMKSNFVSGLMDMTQSAEDFSKDISKILAKTFIEKFVLGEKFDQQMEYWQQQYESIIGSGMSEDERKKQLRALRDAIATAKEGYVNSAMAVQELLGLTTEDSQEATMNMADKITYDQAEQLLGINLAQELTLEQIYAAITGYTGDVPPTPAPIVSVEGDMYASQVIATLQGMADLTRTSSENMLTQVAVANSHLQLIRDYSKTIRDEVVMHLASMDSKLTNLRNL